MSAQPQHSSLQACVDRAIVRLKSLHDGEAGFLEIVGLGREAVPALRELIFTRERSGLYQARCRAAEALGILGAFEVLADFLRSPRQLSDPTERIGEETVISTAARTIARLREEWVYRLLAELAVQRPLNGILAGLGSFHREDSLPILVHALGEDEMRLTAETVLRAFGKAARPAIMAVARNPGVSDRSESESDLRKRRSALDLLIEIGVPRKEWPSLRHLLDDNDTQIALLACKICLRVGEERERAQLSRRLSELRAKADYFVRQQIEDLLASIERAAPLRRSASARPHA